MDAKLKQKPLIHPDASLAGPLLMLAAALAFTVLNILVKTLRPEYTVWHIGFFRFFGGMLLSLSGDALVSFRPLVGVRVSGV